MKSLVILSNGGSALPEKKILGLSLEDRVARGGQKAGFVPEGMGNEGTLILFPDFLFSSEGWGKLASLPLKEGEVYISPQNRSCALFKSRNPKILEEARNLKSGDEVSRFFEGKLKTQTFELSPRDWMPLEDGASLSRVEKWLLKGLIKDNEGFMSKHLERKISLPLTRLLVRTPLSPNGMTIISLLPGLLGALLFLRAERSWDIAGACLFWLHSVLDGCDGEIARLKYKESRFGGLLDFFGDNLVHSAVFICIGFGWLKRGGPPFAPTLSYAAVFGTLASAALVYWTTLRQKKGPGPLFNHVAEGSVLSRFIDFLARRDFIYLVLLLSIFGKIHWFLIMGAAGAPIYFLILAVIRGHHTFIGKNSGTP